jgi:hypothetical protein
VECAPRSGQIEQLELTTPVGLPEDIDHTARRSEVFRQARRLNLWPRSRVATLRAFWRSGLSMAAIGRQLGVSGSRVFTKVHELGFPPRQRTPKASSCSPSAGGSKTIAKARIPSLVCARPCVRPEPMLQHLRWINWSP